ncbi:hypothetical protein B0H17DRAFT_1106096, partial [Mycena rosella]
MLAWIVPPTVGPETQDAYRDTPNFQVPANAIAMLADPAKVPLPQQPFRGGCGRRLPHSCPALHGRRAEAPPYASSRLRRAGCSHLPLLRVYCRYSL